MKRIVPFAHFGLFVFLCNVLFSAAAALISVSPMAAPEPAVIVRALGISMITVGSIFGVLVFYLFRRRELPLYINAGLHPRRLIAAASSINALFGCAVLVGALLLPS